MSAVRSMPVREVLRSGRHPEDAAHIHAQAYGRATVRFDVGRSPFRFRYRTVDDGRVALCTSSVSAPWTARVAPRRQYVLAWSVEGGVILDADRTDAVVMRPGTPVMYPAGRTVNVASPAGTQHLVRFDADYLEAVTAIGDGAPRPLDVPVTVPRARLAGVQDAVRRTAPRLLDVHTPDDEREALDLDLARAVLDAFCPMPDGLVPDVGASTLERAKALMHARFDEPLTATQIALGVGVSVRTLQETFQREAGVTPMTYLRDIRLAKARLALQLGDPRETSVGTLAQSCGFRHMGRFSGTYRHEFGEYPADTLRHPGRDSSDGTGRVGTGSVGSGRVGTGSR